MLRSFSVRPRHLRWVIRRQMAKALAHSLSLQKEAAALLPAAARAAKMTRPGSHTNHRRALRRPSAGAGIADVLQEAPQFSLAMTGPSQ